MAHYRAPAASRQCSVERGPAHSLWRRPFLARRPLALRSTRSDVLQHPNPGSEQTGPRSCTSRPTSPPVERRRYPPGGLSAARFPTTCAWKNVVYRPNATTYDVVIYECATGRPVDNRQRSGALLWGPGQHTVIAGVQDQNAAGRLVYALNVGLNPATVKAGQAARLDASVADDFVAQADRTLNISVDPHGWAVTSWTVDFGDGQGATLPGGSTRMAADHTYAAPSAVQPRVTAHVAGTAQVADFDPATGDIVLLTAAVHRRRDQQHQRSRQSATGGRLHAARGQSRPRRPARAGTAAAAAARLRHHRGAPRHHGLPLCPADCRA